MEQQTLYRKIAITGLLAGILSCFLGWVIPVPIIGQIISLIIGITGLILTIVARKGITETGSKSKIITASLIISIIGIISSVLSIFTCGFLTLNAIYTTSSTQITQTDSDAFRSQLESVLENVN